jgi:hypothetical protein
VLNCHTEGMVANMGLLEEVGFCRDYVVELIVDARGKQRHLLSKLVLTDRKVVF